MKTRFSALPALCVALFPVSAFAENDPETCATEIATVTYVARVRAGESRLDLEFPGGETARAAMVGVTEYEAGSRAGREILELLGDKEVVVGALTKAEAATVGRIEFVAAEYPPRIRPGTPTVGVTYARLLDAHERLRFGFFVSDSMYLARCE